MSQRSRRLIVGGTLVLAVAGLVAHALSYRFISDDAYISFRYAYNLAYHGELTFNLGERVEGYTNFLWTALLGLLLKAGLRLEVMAHVLGALFGAATLLLTVALTRLYRGGSANGWDLLAALMLPAMAPFAVWCSGGLETQMFTALALAGATAYVAEAAGRLRRRPSGVFFALSAMTRPEGLLLFGLTVLHRLAANLIGERRLMPTRSEILWIAGFAAPFAAYFAWRYSYYGYPFPNTFYVKAGSGASASALSWGLPYLWDFVRDNKLYLLAPLAVLFALLRPRTCWGSVGGCGGGKAVAGKAVAGEATGGPVGGRPTGVRPAFVWSYLALISLTFVAYIVRVGGDFMAMGRFFVPILPYVAFLTQEALRELTELPRRRAADDWRPARMLPVGVAVLALLVANSVSLYRDNSRPSYYRWGLDTIAYLDRFAADRIIIGKWMRRSLPADTFLAVGGAGAIVYASRLRALDTFGLNDAWIAHHGPRTGDRPGHTKSAPDSYLLQKKPDLMCHQAKHQDWPYRPPAGEALLWRQRGYEWVCLDPAGLRPAYYCCLKKIGRELGPFPAYSERSALSSPAPRPTALAGNEEGR